MDGNRDNGLATALVLLTGSFWGLYWVPVREIAALGLPGAWGSVGIVGAGAFLLAPFAWRTRAHLRAADVSGVLSVALGGFAFILYSISFLYGQVAVVVLLFFLTPVWSTILGRILFGWPVTGLRVLVLVCGLAGLAVMLGGAGGWPLPRSLGEWLGLASGLLWSLASTGIRVRRTPPPVTGAFVFAMGGFLGGLLLAPLLAPLPTGADIPQTIELLLWVGGTGLFWWALCLAALMWATPRLEPARTGILLMAEVLVGALSAALLAAELLSPAQLIGGALVLAAGVLEVWPQRTRSEATQ